MCSKLDCKTSKSYQRNSRFMLVHHFVRNIIIKSTLFFAHSNLYTVSLRIKYQYLNCTYSSRRCKHVWSYSTAYQLCRLCARGCTSYTTSSRTRDGTRMNVWLSSCYKKSYNYIIKSHTYMYICFINERIRLLIKDVYKQHIYKSFIKKFEQYI